MRRAGALVAIIVSIGVSTLVLVAGIALTVIAFGFNSGIQTSSAMISGPGTAILTDIVGTRRSVPGAQIVLRVDSVGGQPVFVGVADPQDVDRLLAGVAYDVLPGLDSDAGLRSVPGGDQAPLPGRSRIWVASAQGQSARLVWTFQDDRRALALMNANGSGAVSVRVVTLISLATPGWKIVSVSLVGLGVLGVILCALAVRRYRRGPAPVGQHAASPHKVETEATPEVAPGPMPDASNERVEVPGVDGT